MFSKDPALLIKSRVASNIFCRIGAFAEQATKAKYLKMILNSEIVFALEIVDVPDSFLCLTNASNLLVSWVKSAKNNIGIPQFPIEKQKTLKAFTNFSRKMQKMRMVFTNFKKKMLRAFIRFQ